MAKKLGVLLGVLAALVLWFVGGNMRYDLYRFPGSSMTPTIPPDSQVFARSSSTGRAGDIVAFEGPTQGGQVLVSRVIAIGGQTISFADGRVVVEGQQLVEDYIMLAGSTSSRSAIPGCDQAEPREDSCVVPAGSVFVMGDNREGSSDSRTFGPVRTSSIEGRVVDAPFWFRIDLVS